MIKRMFQIIGFAITVPCIIVYGELKGAWDMIVETYSYVTKGDDK